MARASIECITGKNSPPFRVSLLGGLAIPLYCFGIVLRNAFALAILLTEIVLGILHILAWLPYGTSEPI